MEIYTKQEEASTNLEIAYCHMMDTKAVYQASKSYTDYAVWTKAEEEYSDVYAAEGDPALIVIPEDDY